MMEKDPFTREKLDDERAEDKRKVFSVSLNEAEQAWLDEIKQDMNISADGKALKASAFIGRNVLHTLFGRKFLKYLFKKERKKYDNP